MKLILNRAESLKYLRRGMTGALQLPEGDDKIQFVPKGDGEFEIHIDSVEEPKVEVQALAAPVARAIPHESPSLPERVKTDAEINALIRQSRALEGELPPSGVGGGHVRVGRTLEELGASDWRDELPR